MILKDEQRVNIKYPSDELINNSIHYIVQLTKKKRPMEVFMSMYKQFNFRFIFMTFYSYLIIIMLILGVSYIFTK